MSEAPERIWACAGTFRMWRDHKTDRPHTQTEYVRADRIEKLEARVAELEAANRGLVRLNETTEARAKAAEAKLAKATEALEGVRSFTRDLGLYADQGHTLAPALRKACDTLAELKGEQ